MKKKIFKTLSYFCHGNKRLNDIWHTSSWRYSCGLNYDHDFVRKGGERLGCFIASCCIHVHGTRILVSDKHRHDWNEVCLFLIIPYLSLLHFTSRILLIVVYFCQLMKHRMLTSTNMWGFFLSQTKFYKWYRSFDLHENSFSRDLLMTQFALYIHSRQTHLSHGR